MSCASQNHCICLHPWPQAASHACSAHSPFQPRGFSLQTQAQVLGVPGDSKRPNSGSLSLGRFVQLSDFIGATLIQLDMPTKPVTAIPLIWPLPGGGAVIATLGLLRNSSVFRYCKSWNWGIFYTPFLWCLQSTEMIFRRGRVISYLRGM